MSVPKAQGSALDDVAAELVAREPIFHKPELGTTREAYLAQTAEDFWEVGASGRTYDRAGESRDSSSAERFPATNTGSSARRSVASSGQTRTL
jgi:hypothetical protein